MPEYSYSVDEENYTGVFATAEEACAEAAADADVGKTFWVGENAPPAQPETWWRAEDWLEHVSCQDEYSMDCCEGWDNSTTEQQEELEKEVRAVMAAWLDRHDLRPKFWTIQKAVEYRVADDGKWEKVEKAKCDHCGKYREIVARDCQTQFCRQCCPPQASPQNDNPPGPYRHLSGSDLNDGASV